jgi:hypothetical protein
MFNIPNIKHNISRYLTNIHGWRTSRKIVVIESDDWGSIRMPSSKVYHHLLKKGIRVDKCPFNRYDSLASEQDLTALFEVLSKQKDKNGHHPVITANCLLANPDFKKIRATGFSEYHFELFTETLKHYPKHHSVFSLWKEGIINRIFYPQLHGREHLNVKRWLRFLQNGSNETMLAFDLGLYGISTNITKEKRKSFLAALDLDDFSDLKWQHQMLSESFRLFEEIFSYHSSSFIATNYTWHPEVEQTLAKGGVKYIQGANNQKQPDLNVDIIKRHHLGQKNDFGQIYLIRNCIFEPSLNENKDWISSCLKEINTAFFFNKPAVISSHRLNYIGFIDEKNRNRNLNYLQSLLTGMIQRWPDVEFLNSEELGNILTGKVEKNGRDN